MPTLSTTGRNAACDAIVDLLDSGTIVFETSANNEVATCTFGATAFGAASTGVATANAITSDTSATGGTIDHAVLKTSGAAAILTLTCTVTGGGGDLTGTSLSIGAGDTVSISALTVTVPAS